VANVVANVEEVVRGRRHDPRAEPSLPPPESPEPEPPSREQSPAELALALAPTMPPAATMLDARFAEVEVLLGRNAWREIIELLTPHHASGGLAPGLTLVLALAQREAGDASVSANTLAIESMAELLGAPPSSHVALVLAKRLLRQPPASSRSTAAPPARYTIPIVVVAIALGAAAGWFANPGAFRLPF